MKNRTNKRMIAVLLLMVVFSSIRSQTPAISSTLLYKISGKGLKQDSYFLLTTTKTCEPKINLSNKMIVALSKVKLIALETGLNSKVNSGVAKKFNAVKNENQSAEKVLSAATYDKLKDVAEEEGIPELYLNQYKLWYIYMFLMTKTYQCGVTNAEKIDDVIRTYGAKHSIPVKELLTIDETLNIMYDKFPNTYWESVISYMVNNKGRVETDIESKSGFYKQENLAGLKRLMTTSGLFRPRYVASNAEMSRMQLVMARVENTIKAQPSMITLDVIDAANDATSLFTLLGKSGYTISPVL